ncbi:ABC transporter permease [Paenibacillus ginsengarvi]|uniref:Permease n=1 Tax=Paenibacillus ginsengarvi TaxID=400777 RepID=A0A3B0CH82_9BACL|nr:ABC transporter permease [Paenibacillus ginsengarvi]RKN84301.1 permease [Paenibacillus ginsengarvi]
MIWRVLGADFAKIRKKMIWFLIFLGPLGVVALQGLNFALRYDYLTKLYADDLWGGVLYNTRLLAVPTLLMGLAIVISMIATVEHQTNAWKQVLALPVSRLSVYTAKLLLACTLLAASSTMLGAGTIVLGLALGYGADIPFGTILRMIYYPFLAAMPLVALQTWLSVIVKNQAIPLTVGITCAITSMFAAWYPDWMPLKWPYVADTWEKPLLFVAAGVAVGLAVYAAGAANFARKDVQ